MTLRAYGALLGACFSLFVALSLGHTLPLLIAALLFFALLLCLVSALIARATVRVQVRTQSAQVLRGEEGTLFIDAAVFSPLPLSPTLFTFLPPDGGQPYCYGVELPYLRGCRLQERCVFSHVGAFDFGLQSVSVSDALSLFRFTRRLNAHERMLVLPRVGEADPMPFSPGDEMDVQLEKRARDDATMPADVRAYQQGDELKRVHWKLSLRKRQLMVRTFDVPARPDALVLLDCAMPDVSDSDTAHTLRDMLCEEAVSIAGAQLSAGHAVHMPLCGHKHIEAGAANIADLPVLQRQLALCDFAGDPQFERVLLSETRRLRRTGATAILTTRLSPQLTDWTEQIRRMGPCVRFVFVCLDEPDEDRRRLLTRLEACGIDVRVQTLLTLPGKESA